ncbi:MAG: sigma-54-dependent Fis family transcriptional regulator [Candidatus Moranbacteria bacterium]|nr:sigma-54-dependent Fis family transcriptional regulator [Candidatus Moranbacteria bacterium]
MNAISLVDTGATLCKRCHRELKLVSHGFCSACSDGYSRKKKQLGENLTPEQYVSRFPSGKRHGLDNTRTAPPAISSSPTSTKRELISGFIYASADMHRMVEIIRRLAREDITVLILGETGVGKELVAKALHELGPRSQRPFQTIDCTTLGGDIAANELFGHIQGAFTGATKNRKGLFAEGDGGTVFLDELAVLPLATQSMLLRVLEQREYRQVGSSEYQPIDVRVIGASNEPLEDLVRQGRFRADLFHRLSVFPLHIPPLRERRDEIPMLIRHFLGERENPPARITDESLERLMNHDWPGNIRELRNVLRRALILRDDDLAPISLSELPNEVFGAPLSRRA